MHRTRSGWRVRFGEWLMLAGLAVIAAAAIVLRKPWIISAAKFAVYFVLISFLLTEGFMSFRRRRRFACGECVHCGYDLRGAAHVQCPECGVGVPDRRRARR